jgi:hypothetical protein
MKLNMHINDFNWWFWVIGLLFIVIAFAGWEPAYYLVMEVYLLNVLNSLVSDKKLSALSVQVRLVYLTLSFGGFWPAGRIYLFFILIVLSFIVAFTGKCVVASFLKLMPWNREKNQNFINVN